MYQLVSITSRTIITTTTDRKCFCNSGLYAGHQLYTFDEPMTKRCMFSLGKRAHFLRNRAMGSCAVQDKSRFVLKKPSMDLLIWRKQCARYNQSNISDTHSCRSNVILIWVLGSLGCHSVLHMLNIGTDWGIGYRNNIFDQYVH